jgi:hypothetical protein
MKQDDETYADSALSDDCVGSLIRVSLKVCISEDNCTSAYQDNSQLPVEKQSSISQDLRGGTLRELCVLSNIGDVTSTFIAVGSQVNRSQQRYSLM